MKRLISLLAAPLVALLLVMGCSETPSKETIGAGAGAVVGGVLGSKIGDESTAATIGGTILGAVIGGAIGRRMDEADRQRVYNSLENNEATSWSNPETDARYAFNPTDTYRGPEGQLCREYTTTVVIEGRKEIARGTACKQSDGTWEVVSS